MRRDFILIVLALQGALLAGCHEGQVRIPVAAGQRAHVWRSLLDCDSFSAPAIELLYRVEPPIGYASARDQPVEGLPLSTKLRWDDAVVFLVTRFEQLCRRHNAAAVSLEEFDRHRTELRDAVARLTRQRRALEQALASYSEASVAASRMSDDTSAREDARSRMQTARETVDSIVKNAAEVVRQAAEATLPEPPQQAKSGGEPEGISEAPAVSISSR